MPIARQFETRRYRSSVVAFALDADTTHPPDFALLQAGGMALFRRPNVLRDAEQELGGLGYDHARLEASSWTESDLHDAFASTLSFPGYYGRNLNALADCLYDVAHGDYGWAPKSTGLAVTVDGFGDFAEREPDLAHALAQGLAEATRAGLLFGHRLLWLLQVDNGGFLLGSVGCFHVPWNRHEWLDADRR